MLEQLLSLVGAVVVAAPVADSRYALTLKPAAALIQQLFRNRSLASWGGNVVKSSNASDPHQYHLFAAAFTNGCGLAGWESNSEVIHAVSNAGPAGPFAYHDTALAPWHHNPQAVQAPDGTWLIYSIGQTNASWALPCKDSRPVGKARKQLPRVEVHYSTSLYGNWQLLRPSPDAYDGAIMPFASNPAPIFLPNGSVVVIGTGFGDSLSVAVADTWRGPYRPWVGCRGLPEHKPDWGPANVTRDGCMPFIATQPNCSKPLNYEDPTIWFDSKAQKYKLLFHQYAGCTDGSTVGGYAESATADFFGNWIYDYSFTGYSMNAVPFVDGSNISFHRRERPKVYLENGVAKYLYNGVSPPGAGNNVFTFVQEIDEPPTEPPRRGLKLNDGETNLGALPTLDSVVYAKNTLSPNKEEIGVAFAPISSLKLDDDDRSISYSEPYPGPACMHPRVHYAPHNTTAGDIAGALSHNGLHHVWQLTEENFGGGSGWHHRVSRDLVRWDAASVSDPVGPNDWPSGFAIADDEQTAGRICAGMRCDRCKPDDPAKPMCALGKDNTSACQQPPLALRCSTNDAATAWGSYEPMFPVHYYRGLPYDPFRPFQDHDGRWYAGIAIDACNGTTDSVPCQAGGAIAVWSSPHLRGPKADWQSLPHLLFTNNHSIYPGPMSQHGRAELVTIDFFGALPGDASAEWRVIFNNCYDCRGATEYFIGKQSNGSKFEIEYSESTHSMLDWGEFTVNTSAPAGARGVAALSRHSPSPNGGRLCMTRTLGDFATANQVSSRGRRVAIGSTSGMCGFNISTPCTSMQSLPRDLSLRMFETEPILMQAFVPELQTLRRNHTVLATRAFGQQLELHVVFRTKHRAMAATSLFGLSVLRSSDAEETTVLVDPARGLVCINGTLQGNPEPRCAPYRSGQVATETAFHLIVDHSILELIVNNVSAITASVAPRSAHAGGVALYGIQSESERAGEVAGVVAKTVDIWTLADANNQPGPRPTVSKTDDNTGKTLDDDDTSDDGASAIAHRLPRSPFPVSAAPSTVTVFDMANATADERVLVLTAVGIVAKRSSELATVDSTGTRGPDNETSLREWHLQQLNVSLDQTARHDLTAIMRRFAADFRGYILAAGENESMHVAVGLAGILHAVVVTAETVEHPGIKAAGLTQLLDARTLTLEAAFKKYSANYSIGLLFNQKKARLGGTTDLAVFADAFTLYDADLSSRLAQSALRRLKNISFVLGWADEVGFVTSASRHGHQVLCSDSNFNLPLYMSYAPPPPPPAPPPAPPPKCLADPKDSRHVVAFMFTDGDSITFDIEEFASAHADWWASPKRGRVPITWTFQPVLQELDPVYLAWIKSTASANDTLIVGPSGAGYTYLDQYPDSDHRRAFAEWTAANVERSGLVNMVNQIQLTAFDESVEKEQLELDIPPEAIFVDVEKVLTIKGNARRLHGSNGQPTDTILSSRRHCLSKTFGDVTPAELVALLNTKAPNTPAVVEGYSMIGVEVWGYGVSDIVGVAEQLDSERVRVVGIGEFVACLKERALPLKTNDASAVGAAPVFPPLPQATIEMKTDDDVPEEVAEYKDKLRIEKGALSPTDSSWTFPAVNWTGKGYALPSIKGKVVRAVDSIVWPADGQTYIYSDINPQAEIGAFSSHDGLSNWTYHGIVVHKNTSLADRGGVGTPSALVANGKVFIYFKYSALGNAPRGIGIAASSNPLGPFQRLSPAHAAPQDCDWSAGAGWKHCSSGIFDDSHVFVHDGSYHMFHSRKWSNDTPGCISNAVWGRNDCVEWLVSKDAMHWEQRGVVLAARGDPKVGNRSCTGKPLACIQGGLEPMSARIYGGQLVLITDGQDFKAFVAPVAGLAAPDATGLTFEKANTPYLSPDNGVLPIGVVYTAIRVMPQTGEPHFVGVSRGRTFVVWPVKKQVSLKNDDETGSLAAELRALALLHIDGHLSNTEFSEAKQTVLRKSAVPHRSTGAGYSVIDFGADGTGRNDSTAAFNAAFAAASATYIYHGCGHGCDRSVADVFVPAGEYKLSAAIDMGVAPGIRGEGTPILRQTNSSADIFSNPGVWRTQIAGLSFIGGRNHLHFGTHNTDSSFITVERCTFANASSAAIRMMPPTGLSSNHSAGVYHGSASTQFTVRSSIFNNNEQVVVNWCDGFSFLDSWVEGCYEPTCSKGKALFENHDTLFIERLMGVPRPVKGNDQRWIDNCNGMIIARNSRFGGEGGGFTIVVNKASFLRVPGYLSHYAGAGSGMPPGSGPLPPGTAWGAEPQSSTVILDACQIDSDGNHERQANVWLEQLPSVLVVERNQGFAYAPKFGPSANFSFLKVDPALDLDGPQLDVAARHPHMLRYSVGFTNNWGPAGHFWQLPQQLWPYLASPPFAFVPGTDTPSAAPPTRGVWQRNQVVLAPLNSSASAERGWRCIEGGRPGKWTGLKSDDRSSSHVTVKPGESIQGAVRKEKVAILFLAAGVHYLSQTIVPTAADAGLRIVGHVDDDETGSLAAELRALALFHFKTDDEALDLHSQIARRTKAGGGMARFYRAIVPIVAVPSTTSAEPRLVVGLSSTGTGLLQASIEALEPGIQSRLRVQLSPDTPVLAGTGAGSSTQSAGTLRLLTNESDTGRDFIGAFAETSLLWGLVSHHTHEKQPSLSTSLRRYADFPRVVVFGANVLGAPLLRTNRTGSQLPVIGYPSINLASSEGLGYAFWHGLWPDPVIGRNLSIPLPGRPNYHDGPVVFSAPEADGKPRLSLLLGPLSDPLTTVFGVARHGSDDSGGSLYFGPSPRVDSLPVGYNYSVVAVLGDGVTDAVQRYGELLQRKAAAAGVRSRKLEDPTLQSLSAWTDNGAYYFWNQVGAKMLPPPAKVLPEWLTSLRDQGVNVSTLQLDGWWMAQLNSTPDATFWPDHSWDEFLHRIGKTQRTPLMLYKAFFSAGYDLFEKLGCAAAVSPQGAHYPFPSCARTFYSALFVAFKAIAPTFEAYETDFISDHLLPTAGLAGEAGGLARFFAGMAEAAEAAEMPVQLCMPTAGVVLASVDWPAMTNGRVSTDYATEAAPNSSWAKTYNIGVGSLLFWAVGLQPSKDVTWTAPHQPGGGCNHDNPNIELDFVLAVLSGGPVGIGDGIGWTNATLAKMGANSAGAILRPSKPLTGLDSTFVPAGAPRAGAGSERSLVGFLPLMSGTTGCSMPRPPGAPNPANCQPAAEQTHTLVPLEPSYVARLGLSKQGSVAWRILVSLHLGAFVPAPSDLLPIDNQQEFALSSYREFRWQRCVNGSRAFSVGCLERLDHVALFDISSGDRASPVGEPVPWRMFTLFPRLPEAATGARAWTLLGEVDKIVSVAAVRFLSVAVELSEGESCLAFEIEVALGEEVAIGAVTPGGDYQERMFTVGGWQRICEAYTAGVTNWGHPATHGQRRVGSRLKIDDTGGAPATFAAPAPQLHLWCDEPCTLAQPLQGSRAMATITWGDGGGSSSPPPPWVRLDRADSVDDNWVYGQRWPRWSKTSDGSFGFDWLAGTRRYNGSTYGLTVVASGWSARYNGTRLTPNSSNATVFYTRDYWNTLAELEVEDTGQPAAVRLRGVPGKGVNSSSTWPKGLEWAEVCSFEVYALDPVPKYKPKLNFQSVPGLHQTSRSCEINVTFGKPGVWYWGVEGIRHGENQQSSSAGGNWDHPREHPTAVVIPFLNGSHPPLPDGFIGSVHVVQPLRTPTQFCIIQSHVSVFPSAALKIPVCPEVGVSIPKIPQFASVLAPQWLTVLPKDNQTAPEYASAQLNGTVAVPAGYGPVAGNSEPRVRQTFQSHRWETYNDFIRLYLTFVEPAHAGKSVSLHLLLHDTLAELRAAESDPSLWQTLTLELVATPDLRRQLGLGTTKLQTSVTWSDAGLFLTGTTPDGHFDFVETYAKLGFNTVPGHCGRGDVPWDGPPPPPGYSSGALDVQWSYPGNRTAAHGWSSGLQFGPEMSGFGRVFSMSKKPLNASLLPREFVVDEAAEMLKWERAKNFTANGSKSHPMVDMAYDGAFLKADIADFCAAVNASRPEWIFVDDEGWPSYEGWTMFASNSANAQARRLPGETQADLSWRMVSEFLHQWSDCLRSMPSLSGGRTMIGYYGTTFRPGLYQPAGFVSMPSVYDAMKDLETFSATVQEYRREMVHVEPDDGLGGTPGELSARRQLLPWLTGCTYGQMNARDVFAGALHSFAGGASGFAFFAASCFDDPGKILALSTSAALAAPFEEHFFKGQSISRPDQLTYETNVLAVAGVRLGLDAWLVATPRAAPGLLSFSLSLPFAAEDGDAYGGPTKVAVCELISGVSLMVPLSGGTATISLHVAGTVVLHVQTTAAASKRACVGTKLWFPSGQAGAISKTMTPRAVD